MKKLILNIFIIIVFVNCGGSDDPEPIPPTQPNPEAAILTFPNKDAECTEGTNKTAENSTILFDWNNSVHTDSYELVLKNLESGSVTNHMSTTSELSIELLRGTPYSWSVISKSTEVTSTAKSDTWKFYNAGEGAVWYAPFPAEAVAPVNGATVTPTDGEITLDWTASDVDNDIATYDLFFGATSPPASFSTGLTSSTKTAITVADSTTYYWYIVTKDDQNNSSTSEIFEFNTN